ncbi:hypothetical protein RFI_12939 [Reticulomyxa filosa]|uniref:Uncharacterized protein n=1 Tax=Reticulomyxa filosa TaxID=46433 RepID=X6NEA1_RETFI|nr:hypothetical protein RFI_12939 [Reticulomyxa filosa]|eukprot:ETO24218.1 hypothetical protein RFI_12939 [Reticulomyxa filosa]
MKEYRARKKKWNQSETHCLQGACRIIKMFIMKLHRMNEFKDYWTFYLNTIVQLMDLNPDVASSGIGCLQDIAQAELFLNCCAKNMKYWNELIECYRAIIHSLANKELKKRKDETQLVSIFDSLIESIKDLLNPNLPSRKLFTLQQIESVLSTLEHLVSDKQFDPFSESLEMLDVRLTRLKNVLSIYEQLPPLSTAIAISVIAKITGYFSYLQKCCVGYSYHTNQVAQAKKADVKTPGNIVDTAPVTAKPDDLTKSMPKPSAKVFFFFFFFLISKNKNEMQ